MNRIIDGDGESPALRWCPAPSFFSPDPSNPGAPPSAVIAGRARGSRDGSGTWGPTREDGAPGQSTGTHSASCCPPPPAGWLAGPRAPSRRGCQDSRFPAAQDVSSLSPYLVKVFQDSVIQLSGAAAATAAAALGAGPATARLPRC